MNDRRRVRENAGRARRSPWTMHSGGTKNFSHPHVGGETMVDELEQRGTLTNGDSIYGWAPTTCPIFTR